MNLQELLNSLKQLVPELSDEQMEQISAILRLGMGEPAEELPIEGEVTDEMRAYFGLETWIDPWKAAASLDEILTVIQNVVTLTPEQQEKVAAILQLALASALAEEEPLEDDMLMEDEYEDDMLEEGSENDLEDDEIRAIVDSAFDEVYGSVPARRSRRPVRSVNRPPYAWTPAQREKPMTAPHLLKFGETAPAIKAIANDLYGSDYELKRYKQQRAFATYVRHGKEALDRDARKSLKMVILTPSQLKAYAYNGVPTASIKSDMSEVVDQLGAFLVPEDFRTDMIERLPGLTIIRNLADVYTTGSDMMTRVKVTGGNDRRTSAVTVSWVGDIPASGSADTRPTFSVERTPVHICKATIHVPMALMEDTPFPLVQKINEWVSQSFGIDEDEQFLIGTGIAKPQGILPDSANTVLGSSQEVISGSNSTILFDSLVDVVYTLAQQYWAGCVWIMNRTTAKVIRKLKDGNGDYLWEENVQIGQPPTLLNYPVYMDDAMPDVAQNAYPVIFGNIKEGYQIADRIGMSVIRDGVTQAEEDLVKFIFRRRLGGQVKQEVALACLKISAT